jgi:hypothetical protein
LPLDNVQAEAPVDLDAAQPPLQRHPARDEADEQFPPPPRAPRSYGKYIRMGLVLLLIVAAGSLGYWQRSNIASVAGTVMALLRPSAAPPAREATAPARPKITDRIGQPSSEPSTGPAVAQRVVLYEEEPDDPQGKRFVGTVLWRTEMRPAAPGRPPELAVRADIEVPERKMSVTLSLRRNTDQSLPASHTIEIVFTLPADSSSGGVQKVPGVLMKQAEQTRGVPLAGLAVPVTPGYFLIGLSSLESDMQRNVQLLKERGWFDIPIIYNNNRRAHAQAGRRQERRRQARQHVPLPRRYRRGAPEGPRRVQGVGRAGRLDDEALGGEGQRAGDQPRGARQDPRQVLSRGMR